MASNNGYANPDVLVTTNWAFEHRKDANLRFVEVDVDTSEYEKGHIEGAIGWNWKTQLQDQTRRDILSKEQIERFLGESGVGPDTGLILYGDNNNWFAAYAFWLLKYYGHADVRLINGGRKKWVAEGKPLTANVPHYETKAYKVSKVDVSMNRRTVWLMSAPTMSTLERFSHLRDCRNCLCAEGIFPERKIFPGPRQLTRMEHSNRRPI